MDKLNNLNNELFFQDGGHKKSKDRTIKRTKKQYEKTTKRYSELNISVTESEQIVDSEKIEYSEQEDLIEKITKRERYVCKIVSDEEEDYKKDCPEFKYIPSVLPAVRRIIVLGDIHGDFEVAKKMLKAANLIDDNLNWIGGDTYVVQVGDQVDRCRPKGDYPCNHELGTENDEASDILILKLFTKLHEQAVNAGGKVISLLGNHELMNSQGQLTYVSHAGLKEFENYKDPKNPNKTFISGEAARKYAFEPGNEYGSYLGCSRLGSVIVGSNLFVHAGILPILIKQLEIKDKNDIENINLLIRKWLLKKIDHHNVEKIVSSSKYSMFWTRILGNLPMNMHINDSHCAEYLKPVLETLEIGSVIIGHTPQSFMKFGGINGTCSHKLWRVDNGSSAAFDKFDPEYLNSEDRHVAESRKPQVLEILNDSEFRVLVYDEHK